MSPRVVVTSIALVGAVVPASGCARGPQQAFEEFYVAATRGDGAQLRASLCPSKQLPSSDADLAAGMAVRTVLQSTRVEQQGADRAVVEIVDVQGRTTRVVARVRDGRWCIDVDAAADDVAQASP